MNRGDAFGCILLIVLRENGLKHRYINLHVFYIFIAEPVLDLVKQFAYCIVNFIDVVARTLVFYLVCDEILETRASHPLKREKSVISVGYETRAQKNFFQQRKAPIQLDE